MTTVVHPSVIVARRLCFCGEYEGKVRFRQVNMAALSLSARKGDNRPAHEKQAPDFTVRYVVAKCCRYQHSTVVVLES